MAKYQCVVCGANARTPHCFAHKPRKPIARTPLKPRLSPVRGALASKTPSKAVRKKKLTTGALKGSPKRKTRKQLVKELDELFSRYIRQSRPPICVSCGKRDSPKNLQNGHYYSRGKYPTRWHEDNCHVQCVGCNIFKKGNYPDYALFMVNRYGVEYVQKLRDLAYSNRKISSVELQEKINHYKKLLT